MVMATLAPITASTRSTIRLKDHLRACLRSPMGLRRRRFRRPSRSEERRHARAYRGTSAALGGDNRRVPKGCRGRPPGSLPPLAGAAWPAFATAPAGSAGLGPTQPPCDFSNRLLTRLITLNGGPGSSETDAQRNAAPPYAALAKRVGKARRSPA